MQLRPVSILTECNVAPAWIHFLQFLLSPKTSASVGVEAQVLLPRLPLVNMPLSIMIRMQFLLSGHPIAWALEVQGPTSFWGSPFYPWKLVANRNIFIVRIWHRGLHNTRWSYAWFCSTEFQKTGQNGSFTKEFSNYLVTATLFPLQFLFFGLNIQVPSIIPLHKCFQIPSPPWWLSGTCFHFSIFFLQHTLTQSQQYSGLVLPRWSEVGF